MILKIPAPLPFTKETLTKDGYYKFAETSYSASKDFDMSTTLGLNKFEGLKGTKINISLQYKQEYFVKSWYYDTMATANAGAFLSSRITVLGKDALEEGFKEWLEKLGRTGVNNPAVGF